MKTISALKLIKAIRKDKSWIAHEVVQSATNSIRVSVEEWYAEKSRADRLEAERDALKARAQRLEAALRFYADFYENPNDGPWGIDSQDYGSKARAALKGGE